MKNIYKFILIISLSILTVSCEEEATLDLDTNEPRLVIDAVISEGKPCRVNITMTQSFYDNAPYMRVSGATIILTDDTGYSEELKEEYGLPGIYQSSGTGIVGLQYSLKVIVDGGIYEASATIPQVVELEEAYIYDMRAGNKSYYSPSVIFQDPEGVKNYYYTRVSVNEKVLSTLYLHNDDSRDGKLIHRILFFDKGANDDKALEGGDNIDIEMQSIDYGMYEFYRSWSSFAGGNSNPTTNFTGNVLGCFKAYSSSYLSMVVSASSIFEGNY